MQKLLFIYYYDTTSFLSAIFRFIPKIAGFSRKVAKFVEIHSHYFCTVLYAQKSTAKN